LPKKQEVAALEERVRPKRAERKIIEEFKNQVEALEGWQKSEEYWPEVLAVLTKVFPPDEEACVTLMVFETKPKTKSKMRTSMVKMRLCTATPGKVHEYSSTLRELGFEDVKVGKETPITGSRAAGVYKSNHRIEAEVPRVPS